MPLTVPPLVGPHDRMVVDVTGEDRTDYLDDVLSQRLRGLEPPVATSALELGPHGEPRGVVDLAVLADRVVLLVPSTQADVTERLAGRTFLADAHFAPRDDLAVVRVRGEADAVLATLGAGTSHGELTVDDTVVAGSEVLWLRWSHGADAVVPAGQVDTVVAAVEAAGAARADAARLDDAEVAAGVPRAPEEIATGRLPEELGLLPTHVHLDKGCYPGQEAVARMWMLGRPRRHLAIVALPAGTGPGPVGETGVEVTRTATVDDTTVGLAFVGRGTAAGDRPDDGIEVLQLVGEDRPVPGHDPGVKRRRDR